jgi:ethanolamine utilization protein EutJ
MRATELTAAKDPIAAFAGQVLTGETDASRDGLRLGVDLGTANIVLSVIDARNTPVAGTWEQSSVVRDGIVVDWPGAVSAVRRMRTSLELRLATRLTRASVAVPPGIAASTVKIFTNVLDAADLEVDEVVDEPVAAARVLGVTDGAVIDVGHGTTGVSLLRDGQVVLSVDEPTGGHHMTLVLAGALHLPYDEAERVKKDPTLADLVFGIVRPVVEKMATIAARALAGQDVRQAHVVGGSSSLPDVPDVFVSALGLPVSRPIEPLFVTPLGIAMVPPHAEGPR